VEHFLGETKITKDFPQHRAWATNVPKVIFMCHAYQIDIQCLFNLFRVFRDFIKINIQQSRKVGGNGKLTILW
jgi:hypothetical protein